MSILYKTTNLVNDKIYIGVHNDTDPEYLGSGYHLYNAIKLYGREHFIRETLFEGTDEEMYSKEEEIVTRDFVNQKENYNIALGGGGCDVPYTEKRRKKVSEANKGRIFSEEHKRNLSEARKGNLHSEETRKKMSEVHKGRIFSDESKRRMSISTKGVPKSEAHKKKLSEARKGKTGITYKQIVCPHCNKIGAANAMPRWHFDNCKNIS